MGNHTIQIALDLVPKEIFPIVVQNFGYYAGHKVGNYIVQKCFSVPAVEPWLEEFAAEFIKHSAVIHQESSRFCFLVKDALVAALTRSGKARIAVSVEAHFQSFKRSKPR